MKRTKNGFFRDIARVTISKFFVLFSSILAGFLLPKIMGLTDYGLYKTFSLYATYIGLFHLGIVDGIYLKFAGSSFDNLPKETVRTYTKAFFLLEIAFSTVAFTITMFFVRGDYQFILIALSAFLLSYNISNYYQVLSQAISRFKELSIRSFIQSICLSLSVVLLWLIHVFCKTSVSYKIYTIIYVLVTVLLSVWYIWTYRSLTFGRSDKSVFFKTFYFIKHGFPLMVANLCSSLILAIDRQFVNVLFTTEVYAVYAFSYNLLTLVTTALSGFATVIFPYLVKMGKERSKEAYTILIPSIIMMGSLLLCVFFPLCPFIAWFLPKYIDSLRIFRIILPGLIVSSAITIIMHNFYKLENKNFVFFLKSFVVLLISFLANFIAYLIFKTTEAISIASIATMFVWYIISERFFVKKYGITWHKNFIVLLIIVFSFYVISFLNNWALGLCLYLFICAASFYVFYGGFTRNVIDRLKGKNKNE